MRKLVIFIVCLISQRSVLAQTLLAILMLFTTTMSFAQDLTINSAEDWNAFASDVNSGSDTYSGKIVKLAANISGITMMVGTSNYPFRGTFDGGNNTLDVNISDVNNRCTAPFRYISGATIKNLKVTGTVTGYWHCAGLVGSTYSDINTITDCTVSTSVQGDYYKGGVVGHGETCTLNITNTVFNGTSAAVSYYTGGLQGWSDGNTLNISNCLFNGVVTGSGPFHPVAISYQKTTASVSKCYYTVAPTLTDVPYSGVKGIIAAEGTMVYAYNGNVFYDNRY